MINKYLLLLMLISAPLVAMEVNECTIHMNIDCSEVLKRKVAVLLKGHDLTTQSIIEGLLIDSSGPKSSQKQKQQKAIIIRKITDSDE